MLEGKDAIQRDRDMLKRTSVNIMKLMAKFKDLGQSNLQYQYRQGSKWIESSHAEDLRIQIDENLDMNQKVLFWAT